MNEKTVDKKVKPKKNKKKKCLTVFRIVIRCVPGTQFIMS